ncbi:MAG: AAA family ATPase [Thermotogota bacterium]
MKKITHEDLLLFKDGEFDFVNTLTEEFDCTKAHSRAFEAMQAGFDIKSRDYNIFVAGDTGTGRRTFVRQTVEKVANAIGSASDWIYVHNFNDQWCPNAIALKAGMAKQLKKDIKKLLEDSLKALDNLFEGEIYQQKAQELKADYDEKQKQLWNQIKSKSKELGFSLKIAPNGIITNPIKDGKRVSQEEIDNLEGEEREAYESNLVKCKQLVEGYLYKSRLLSNEYEEESEKMNVDSAQFALKPIFSQYEKKYSSYKDISDFLDNILNDMMDNLMVLMGDNEEEIQRLYSRYQINVFVDHTGDEGAPVIFELNPTYSNLFGKIEYLSKNGYLYTDHTLIKPGSFHKANGGYIIIEAKDVLNDFYVWDTLKKMLYSQRINVENVESRSGYSSLATIKPEPIPLDIKVILIGEPYLYDLLYEMDPDFEKLFRIKAEFDYELNNTPKNRKLVAAFMKTVIKEKQLNTITPDGVQVIVEHLLRLSGSKQKLSTTFSKISDLLIESSRLAKMEGIEKIDSTLLKKTLALKEHRVSLEREKIDEMIYEGDIIIKTDGEAVGELNGLSVFNTGDYIFGIPARISSDYSLGSSGIVDIQREVDMSGKIYKKAVLTLESFFEANYSKDFPLSVKATTSFEQTYGEIDGDSATIAETISLISAISHVPIKQGIAVTGSMSLKGEVQSVGGISEKVEGFYRICKRCGLTGEQGVIIPDKNLDSLILKEEVIEAVKKGDFHIWTVKHLYEAIEILTGKPAGTKGKKGKFPKDTVNYYLLKNLEKFHKKMQEEHEHDSKNPEPEKEHQ